MPDTITNIHTFDQPIEMSVKVGIEIDSKGQRKPSIEIKTIHHLTMDEAKDGRLLALLDLIITNSLTRCQDTIKKAMDV